MNNHLMKRAALATGAIGIACAPATAAVITFEGLLGGPESYYKGANGVTDFNTDGATFSNSHSSGYYEGFAYSNTTDTTTGTFLNDFSAYTSSGGGGASGSSTYGVAFVGYTSLPSIRYSEALDMAGKGASVTNTTYGYLSMAQGDDFAKKFGGATGTDADWFLLTVTGYLEGVAGGSVEFYLADFRFADSEEDYLVDDWTFVDFTGLGLVDEVRFSLSSSDNGIFGMNTPAYFAIDDIATIPEPSALLLGVAASGLVLRRKRRD